MNHHSNKAVHMHTKVVVPVLVNLVGPNMPAVDPGGGGRGRRGGGWGQCGYHAFVISGV